MALFYAKVLKVIGVEAVIVRSWGEEVRLHFPGHGLSVGDFVSVSGVYRGGKIWVEKSLSHPLYSYKRWVSLVVVLGWGSFHFLRRRSGNGKKKGE